MSPSPCTRHEPRADRVERLAALALRPLAAGVTTLERSLGDVVAGDQPGDVPMSVGGSVEVVRAAADHDAQLDLPIDRCRPARDRDGIVRSDHGIGVLEEHDRRVRRRTARLGGMGGVVLADADDGHGAPDRRPDPRIADVDRGSVRRLQPLGGPGDPIGSQERSVDVIGDGAQIEGLTTEPGNRDLRSRRADAAEG